MLLAQDVFNQGSLGVPGENRSGYLPLLLSSGSGVATGMQILCIPVLLGSQKNPWTGRQEYWVLTSPPPDCHPGKQVT